MEAVPIKRKENDGCCEQIYYMDSWHVLLSFVRFLTCAASFTSSEKHYSQISIRNGVESALSFQLKRWVIQTNSYPASGPTYFSCSESLIFVDCGLPLCCLGHGVLFMNCWATISACS